MRVLITGAYGYLGTALSLHLARENVVVCWGRAPRAAVKDAVLGTLSRAGCVLLGQDAVLPRIGIDAVVHLAGGGASGGKCDNVAEAVADNLTSAQAVLKALNASVRLILASSIYVYGDTKAPACESDPLRPDTVYGQTKALADALWRERNGTVLRFSHIWGRGSGIDFKRDGVTERLARRAAHGAQFVIHGDGEQRLQLLHIDDACQAVEMVLGMPEMPAAVNVAGQTLTINELADTFGVQPARQPGMSESIPREMNTHYIQRLGWMPHRCIANAHEQVIDMMKRSE